METFNFKTTYTIFVFVALAAFDNIILGLFPPLFSSIAEDLGIPIHLLGIVLAVNIFVTCISSVFWGYMAGKYNRKRLIIFGTIFWSVSVFLTSRANNFTEMVICQILIGIGLGCITSIGFSILTDFIPHKNRGMVLSLWGSAQGFGGIIGAIMASVIATSSSWRRPFEIVSIIGLLLVILYFFVKVPSMGEADPELQELIKEGYEYNHTIELKSIHSIVTRKSNILLFLQAFFMNITSSTIIWLPTLYIAKIENLGYSTKIAIIASGFIFALFQIGGISSPFFGHLGDIVQKKSYRARARLSSVFIIAMIPFYILMFIIPMNKLSLPSNDNPLSILFALLNQIVFNPWIGAIFIFSLFASALQSANPPNWLALITDVNLPENRGAAFSIANIANGVGRAIGNALFGILLSYLTFYLKEPQNYIVTLIIFQLFLIPSAIMYIKMSRYNKKDISHVKYTLRKRAQHLKTIQSTEHNQTKKY